MVASSTQQVSHAGELMVERWWVDKHCPPSPMASVKSKELHPAHLGLVEVLQMPMFLVVVYDQDRGTTNG
jgi:hypothetical protein